MTYDLIKLTEDMTRQQKEACWDAAKTEFRNNCDENYAACERMYYLFLDAQTDEAFKALPELRKEMSAINLKLSSPCLKLDFAAAEKLISTGYELDDDMKELIGLFIKAAGQ